MVSFPLALQITVNTKLFLGLFIYYFYYLFIYVAPPFLTFELDGSGQLQAPAALTPVKNSEYPSHVRLDGPQGFFERYGEEKKPYHSREWKYNGYCRYRTHYYVYLRNLYLLSTTICYFSI
jgi:hypothetical protein